MRDRDRARREELLGVPDLPGCISVGDTVEDTERNIREAIALHFEGLREAGEPIPEPQTHVEYVELHGA